jgi:hypothetical protein
VISEAAASDMIGSGEGLRIVSFAN